MKKFLAILFSLCTLLSVFVVSPAAAEVPAAAALFSDMPQDYSTAALEAAVANGLLKGDNGKLMPTASLTRAQMATILVRAFGGTKTASLSSFTDVPEHAWYADYVSKAVYMKAFQGDGSKMYPDRPITRQEAFVVLSSLLSLPGADTAILDQFSDASSVSGWAKDGLAAMVNAGFVSGSDGKLNPNSKITRAEFAVVMDSIVKHYITEAGKYTQVGTGSVLVNVPDVTLKDVTISGDLILGDGIGEGDIILDGVTITGRMVVRGGGVNSIIIIGNSKISDVAVSKVDGNVRLAVQGAASVQNVVVKQGKESVLLEGKMDSVTVAAPAVPVVIQNAEVNKLKVAAVNAVVEVAKDAKVTTATVQTANSTVHVVGVVATVNVDATATAATIETEKGATVGVVNASSEGTAITGDGKVNTANVTANNVKIDTVGTTTKVDKDATGVTSNGYVVTSGVTSTTTETKPKEDLKRETGESTTTYYKLTISITDGSQTVTASTSSSYLSGSTPFYMQAVILVTANRTALKNAFHDAPAAALMDAGIAAYEGSDSDWETFVNNYFSGAVGANVALQNKNATFAQLVGINTITYSGYAVTVTIAAI